MIARYSLPEMSAIWTEEAQYRAWLRVEIALAEAMSELGMIPAEAVAEIRAKADFSIARIHEIEARTRHDVIAFLECVAEQVGDAGRYLHLGVTSSDVIDTALSLRMRDSLHLIIKKVDAVLVALKEKSLRYEQTLCMGRSHGIHAEPTTLGLKFLGHYAEFRRVRERLVQAEKEISVCSLSGPVGTFASIAPRVQSLVAKKLSLAEEEVSTQIIPRDRHAAAFCALALAACAIDRFATEIRHLQRTEVHEIEEGFAKGQKGSSAMPHKKNPVLSENLCGLARVIKGYVAPMLEDVTLWHERDISHSSVERIVLPDAFIALDFALARLSAMIENLQIYEKDILRNVHAMRGLVFSQRALLLLTEKGFSRADAYAIVQACALKVWNSETGETLEGVLMGDEKVRAKASEQEIKSICDMNFYTKYVAQIFDRVLGRK